MYAYTKYFIEDTNTFEDMKKEGQILREILGLKHKDEPSYIRKSNTKTE